MLYGILSFCVTVALMPLARKLAVRLQFIDRPGGHKTHQHDVPPIGGLVIFPVFITLVTLFMSHRQADGWFFMGMILILVTGALDDHYSIPARLKFVLQFVAALMVVLGGAQVRMLGNLFGYGPVGLGILSIPFSVIATVLLINAVNLMDGLDGLAGGMGFIVLAGMAICVTGRPEAIELIILCGALAGFLIFNLRNPWRSRACIFLGDAGSLGLGLSLAWYAIRLGGTAEPAIEPATVAWMLGLPIMDTCGQFARRVREGRHPFDADKNHFHHLFVQAGLPVWQATATILGIIALYSAIGIIGIRIGIAPYVLMYIWAALLLTHIYMAMHPDRYRALIQKAFA